MTGKKNTNKEIRLEAGRATDVLEDLFNDFNRDRKQVYRLNFIRGIFFGFGSALGGTVILALIVWLLSLFSNTWFGPLVRAFQDATSK